MLRGSQEGKVEGSGGKAEWMERDTKRLGRKRERERERERGEERRERKTEERRVDSEFKLSLIHI